ncbi:MAG: hypothetical protein MHMPM18_002494 [Marteilia pararefringens]
MDAAKSAPSQGNREKTNNYFDQLTRTILDLCKDLPSRNKNQIIKSLTNSNKCDIIGEMYSNPKSRPCARISAIPNPIALLSHSGPIL